MQESKLTFREKFIELGIWESLDKREPSANESYAFEALATCLDRDGPFGKYKLTFGLEFSNIIDWVASIVPARGHPQARQYESWWQTGFSAREAICRAIIYTCGQLQVYEQGEEEGNAGK